MKTIQFQSVTSEPTGDDLRLYPDFIISRLMKLGIGRIEADRTLSQKSEVDFVFTAHKTGKTERVGSLPEGMFRHVLARFGPRCGAMEMLYFGQTLFACEGEAEQQKHLHRFSLFVCNEPSMGVWMRLYLYCIDGVWPLKTGPN